MPSSISSLLVSRIAPRRCHRWHQSQNYNNSYNYGLMILRSGHISRKRRLSSLSWATTNTFNSVEARAVRLSQTASNHQYHYRRRFRRQEEEEKNRWNSTTTSTSIVASPIIDNDNDNNDNDNDKNDDATTTTINKQPQPPTPWLTARCGPFSEKLRTESPILFQGNGGFVDWEIPHPDDSAGSVFLGPNGIGKSVLTRAIVQTAKWYKGENNNNNNNNNNDDDMATSIIPKWDPRVQHVSFEAHQELLQTDPSMGVYRAVADGGQLNKAAQFLIVRLGLYGLLDRSVSTLSTGEIRKVLLVRALSRRPDLLILDNALDGLDVTSREHLKDILRKTLQGFRNDILVQGVSANATSRTQVMLLTHRPEEILGDRVTYPEVVENVDVDASSSSRVVLRTEAINGRSGEGLLQLLLPMYQNERSQQNKNDEKKNELWEDPTLELMDDDIQSWWARGRQSEMTNASSPVVNADNLSVHRINRNEKDGSSSTATLLHDLEWTILPGESWLLGGHNGAGKSTLSRLLVQQDDDAAIQNLVVPNPERIGWCSTELHMQMASSVDSAIKVLTRNGTTGTETALQMAEWMLLPGCDDDDDDVAMSPFWERPFFQLSQGQQKMVLISAAIACRPKLLILDEPCQGLDFINRRRVLAMMEQLCRSTDVSMIYITHHQEELVPAVQNVLHLKGGQSVYKGSLKDYDPKTYKAD